MKFNLYWLAVKQVRIGHWLHNKLFDIGLAIHVRRKYGKFNPSVYEIYMKQSHGRTPPKRFASRLEGYTPGSRNAVIRDGNQLLNAGGIEAMPLKSRIRYGIGIARDLAEGKMDHDKALFDQYFAQLQAVFQKIKEEIK